MLCTKCHVFNRTVAAMVLLLFPPRVRLTVDTISITHFPNTRGHFSRSGNLVVSLAKCKNIYLPATANIAAVVVVTVAVAAVVYKNSTQE